MTKNPLKKGVSLEMTEEEYSLWLELVELEKTNSRNVLRRGIRERAKAVGLELPDDAFREREKGNWLPKPAPVIVVISDTGTGNTAVGTAIPTAALIS